MAESEAHSTVEKLWRQSLNYSRQSNDALVTLLTKAMETIDVVVSPSSDNERIEHSINALDYERKVALEFEKKDFVLLRQLSFDLVESLQVLLEVKGKKTEEPKQILVDEAPNSSLTLVVPKKEALHPYDQIYEENQIPIVDEFRGGTPFKEEEIDFNFEDNNDILPTQEALNEFPSNNKDSHGKIVHSDVMGDAMNFMGDPIMEDHNATPIEKDSLDENMGDSVKNEVNRDGNDSIEEENEKDKTVQYTTNASKDSVGVDKKIRHPKTSSRPIKYNESIYESEPLVKKPKIISETKIDNKKGSVIDEALSNTSTKGFRIPKINHAELECPDCEYRSLSVHGWYSHIRSRHTTTPRQMNLALLCECGHESFTYLHSAECEISKITIVRKDARKKTPQCVMCEAFPKTASGYAKHLRIRHKTSLIKMGMFLTCSCGHEVRRDKSYLEHNKECNGLEYALHRVDD